MPMLAELFAGLTADERARLDALNVPLPKHELKRLAVIRQSNVFSMDPKIFEVLGRIFARSFKGCFIIMSIVELDQTILIYHGDFPVTCAHRNHAICTYVILEECLPVLVIPDTAEDERCCKNPFVTAPDGLRFYAAAGIKVAGMRLGAVCVLDTKPRHDFGPEQCSLLQEMAETVAAIIESRRDGVMKEQAELARLEVGVKHSLLQPIQKLMEQKQQLFDQLANTANLSSQSTLLPDSDSLSLATFTEQLRSLQDHMEMSLKLTRCFLPRQLRRKLRSRSFHGSLPSTSFQTPFHLMNQLQAVTGIEWQMAKELALVRMDVLLDMDVSVFVSAFKCLLGAYSVLSTSCTMAMYMPMDGASEQVIVTLMIVSQGIPTFDELSAQACMLGLCQAALAAEQTSVSFESLSDTLCRITFGLRCLVSCQSSGDYNHSHAMAYDMDEFEEDGWSLPSSSTSHSG